MTERYCIDVEGIMERIPHRYPFLLLDGILHCTPGEIHFRRQECFDSTSPGVLGHFPGHPVMPGVLIVETMAQAAGVLIWESVPPEERNFTLYLAAVEKVAVPAARAAGGPTGGHRDADFAPQELLALRCRGRSRRNAGGQFRIRADAGPGAVIDSRAVVSDRARLHQDVSVGPYSIIGPDVEIGPGTRIESHVVVKGPCVIGEDNHIFQFASIGDDPQDKKYAGELPPNWSSATAIPSGNTAPSIAVPFRTPAGHRVGHDNWIMAYVHIAHDCVVGNQTVLANNTTLAGHVHVGDWAVLGGFTGVHQNCRIGAHALTGIFTAVTKDIPAYVTAAGRPAVPRGINAEGLRRRGFGSQPGSAASVRPTGRCTVRDSNWRKRLRSPPPSKPIRMMKFAFCWIPSPRVPVVSFVSRTVVQEPRESGWWRVKPRATRWAAGLIDALSRQPCARGALHGGGRPPHDRRGMRALVSHAEELSVMGLAEVLRHLPRLIRFRRDLLRRRFLAADLDVFVGIDSPDFNLPLESAPETRRHTDCSIRQPPGLGLAPVASCEHSQVGGPGPLPVALRNRASTRPMGSAPGLSATRWPTKYRWIQRWRRPKPRIGA